MMIIGYLWLYVGIIYLGKFDHDLTDLPNPGIIVGEMIPFYGQKIQVSEI